MRLSFRATVLLALCLARTSAARADEPEPQEVLALQRSIQKAIARAEPSVACVLVSRSDGYEKYKKLKPGEKPPPDPPGKLGGFDAGRALAGILDDTEKAAIRALDLGGRDHTPESYGSGVVLDKSGLVLTCAHVVRGATKVFVRLPGGAGSYADIHALDSRSDLAVLKLIEPPADLKPIALGEADGVSKGQVVVSLANPFAAGFRDGSPSASWGVVSNLRRRSPGLTSETARNRMSLHQWGTLLQTDVRLEAGCSGGALVNLRGEMIGLTTSRAALAGVETPGGFALPLDAGLRRIIDVLKRGEEVEYGFLGVQFDQGQTDAVAIEKPIGGSPAQKAGLKPGDTLLAIDGKKIRTVDDVFLALGTALCGSTVEVERSRLGVGSDKVRVTLTKYYVALPQIASVRPAAAAGLRVDHASVSIQRAVGGLQDIPEGVLVREVVSGSPADKAGLQTDKIVTEVNGKKVTTPAEFYRAMADARGEVELTLRRAGGGKQHVKFKPE